MKYFLKIVNNSQNVASRLQATYNTVVVANSWVWNQSLIGKQFAMQFQNNFNIRVKTWFFSNLSDIKQRLCRSFPSFNLVNEFEFTFIQSLIGNFSKFNAYDVIKPKTRLIVKYAHLLEHQHSSQLGVPCIGIVFLVFDLNSVRKIKQ